MLWMFLYCSIWLYCTCSHWGMFSCKVNCECLLTMTVKKSLFIFLILYYNNAVKTPTIFGLFVTTRHISSDSLSVFPSRNRAWCPGQSATWGLEEKHGTRNKYCLHILLFLVILWFPRHHLASQDWRDVHADFRSWNQTIWYLAGGAWAEEQGWYPFHVVKGGESLRNKSRVLARNKNFCPL